MHHKQYSLPYSTDRVPTLLTIDHAIFAKHQTGIGEYARRSFKIDARVLLLVRPVLFSIPFEAHAVIHNV